ncbi:hypothetical protein [Actinoplanes sp. URMC 104]|uniref:hypothetical protein n=1 Tax=Actinoplanes sp. URMC 104 TaxID=3423409 RepID=UPI003F1E46AB
MAPLPESQDAANLQAMLADDTFRGYWDDIRESLRRLTGAAAREALRRMHEPRRFSRFRRPANGVRPRQPEGRRVCRFGCEHLACVPGAERSSRELESVTVLTVRPDQPIHYETPDEVRAHIAVLASEGRTDALADMARALLAELEKHRGEA